MASILIVDDDHSILIFLSEILKRIGHDITLASDGSEAIEIMKTQAFDLIVSDLHMKSVDGIELLRSAKKSDPSQEVLILTAHGSIHSAVKAMKLGAFEYLTKPINIEEFRLKVKQALEHRELKRQIKKQQRKLKEHQELLERDLKLAETVQKTLIPEPVDNEKIVVNVLHKPIIGVGGDYADLYYDRKHTIYLTIVDVTGHGIAAALIVNRVCSDVRKLVREGRTPKEILFHLNNFIIDSFYGTGMFLTVFSCLINLANKQLIYAGSAHPALLFWRAATEEFLRLDSQNPIIGFEKNRENFFVEEVIPIYSGDKLLLYTDGLVDVENENNSPLGISGLVKLVRQTIDESPKIIAENIIAKMNRCRSTPIRDDIYLMVAQIK